METPVLCRLLHTFFHSFVFRGILFLFLLPAVSHAQITLDGSLGPKGPLPGPDYAIDAKVGQLRGNNLFHSFGQFNVHTNESATFTGPSTVENVIGRVTGGQQSFIDGQIRSEMPKADMYLLNPSGVLFGPNATLDVNGSFHVSTADYLRMADGEKFSANLSQQSVLTSAPPAAFGFLGSNPAPIAIQGSSLQVPEGKTLSVIGGDIAVTGGLMVSEQTPSLGAPSGRINLASTASAGEVVPNAVGQASALAVDSFARMGEIEASYALATTSGEGGGAVFIRGGRLVMGNSRIEANSLGAIDGGGIDIHLTDDLVQNDASIETFTGGDGHAGDIRLDVGRLNLTGGAKISSGSGVSIPSTRPPQPPSDDGTGGGSTTFPDLELRVGKGAGGDLVIHATESVTLSGSGLTTSTLGPGAAGDISVSTPVLHLEGGSPLYPGSDSISSDTFGDGRAGEIRIEAGRVTLTDGATISSSSGGRFFVEGRVGTGAGGNVFIHATESVTLSGQNLMGNAGVFTSTKGAGAAGDISVDTPVLQLEGGHILSETNGAGAAGDISVSTPVLRIEGGPTYAESGRISSDTWGDGQAGEIRIEAGRVTLRDGATISSSSQSLSQGAGGNVFIHATESVTLSDQSFMRNTGVFTYTAVFTHTNGAGAAGDISVDTPVLQLEGGSISSMTNGVGAAGDISVNTPVLLMERGHISSDSFGDGRAGEIRIEAERVTLTDSATISSSRPDLPQGATGNVFIHATESMTISDGSGLEASNWSGTAGDISVSTPVLLIERGHISSNTFGDGQGGEIRIEAGRVTLDGAIISSSSFPLFEGIVGTGGKVFIHATESVTISGHITVTLLSPLGVSDVNLPSSLLTYTVGVGAAGDISVSTPVLHLEGGRISSDSFGDGRAGEIRIEAGRVTLRDGAQISSGSGGIVPGNLGPGKIGLVISKGAGGNVLVYATDSIVISGRNSEGRPSSLFTDTLGSGAAGNLSITAATVQLEEGGEIAARTSGSGRGGDIVVQGRQIQLNTGGALTAGSSGTGDAGTIRIQAGETFQSRNGSVSTTATQAGGGQIDLSASQTVELVDSQITTTVQGGAGDAGNITIDPRYVILNDSQVIARAVEGNGGNIFIDADVFLASPTSVVDASSQKGISGTIDIRGAVSNLSGSIAPLPQGYLSTAALVEDRCAGRLREGQVSSFVVAGREGMPLQPGGVLPSPLYEAGQVSAQGGPGRNEGHVVWQVPRVIPIALDGGCGR